MVERKEIEHLGDLVKVELQDPEKYVKQVEQILNYFDRLDKVDFDSEEIIKKEISFDNLREDIHEPFLTEGKPLVEKLKRDNKNFIRAPKMI
jgi:aspartyl-tRNA(Asn)/glutamyl-tRNA(Gln) amidotransferase subunit C